MPGVEEERSTSKDVAARLIQLREALGINAAQLCRRAGIKPNAWSNYEKAVNRISVDEAAKVRRAFGVTLDWIYHGDLSGVRSDVAEKLQAVERPTRIVRRRA